ncbi:MAG TPA: hypothetical protein VJ731_15205 [Terriglobales bacterium]|nr:hypothetical protein [Terriglobales bacterium]
MRFQRSILLTCVAAIFVYAGCAGRSSAPAPSISVAFTGALPSSVQAGGTLKLTASVSNDPSNAGVDWSANCGSSGGCGSFNPTHTASGGPTTYTAPSAVPAGNVVTISAASTANTTKSFSTTITVTTPPISVSFPTAPPTSLQANASATLAAVVSNDSSNAGVDWSARCGTSGACGSFNPTHTASGSATTYTAPNTTPAGNAVIISATSTADNTKAATAQVSILTPQDSLLSGNYVFEVSGVDCSFFGCSPYSLAGQLTADGAGNVTSGEQDFSDYFSSAADGFTGTYSIGPDGRGTLTVDTGDFDLPGGGIETFSIVLVSGSHILVDEFDTSTTSSGTMDAQTVPASGFSADTLSGGYAFALSGLDFFAAPLSWGGVVNVDSPGGISGTGSVADINNGGSVQTSQSISGSVLSVDELGRADILLNAGPHAGVEIIAYIADATHLKVVEIDGILGVTGGTALGQGASTGTFTSNAAISGNFVLGALGIGSPFNSSTAAGQFSSDGAGNLSGVLDLSVEGLASNRNFTGTYSVDSSGTGRGTVTVEASTGVLGTFAFYLAGSGNPAMLVGMDENSTMSGTILPQAAGPFSAASFNGPYALNSIRDYFSNDFDITAEVTADGIANLTGTADTNGFWSAGLQPNVAMTGSFTADASGRFTGTLNAPNMGTWNVAFYVISSSEVLLVETDGINVTLGTLQLQTGIGP